MRMKGENEKRQMSEKMHKKEWERKYEWERKPKRTRKRLWSVNKLRENEKEEKHNKGIQKHVTNDKGSLGEWERLMNEIGREKEWDRNCALVRNWERKEKK